MSVTKAQGMKARARHEVDLAIAENESDHMDELDKIYETALDLYCDFIDGTVEAQIPERMVRSVLSQLMDENPLTPIEDIEDEWKLVEGIDSTGTGTQIYKSKRRPSLYKNVIRSGEKEEIHFSDTGRAFCVDINTGRKRNWGIGITVLDEMMPITFPYEPLGKIKIYEETIKRCSALEEGYDDTIGILYFRLPDGKMINVSRFFTNDCGKMKEIDLETYKKIKKEADQNEKEEKK